MKHYSEAEWLAFKHKSIKDTEFEIMESHLLECEPCFNVFLNLANELELARADTFIPPDFSRTTMDFINHHQVSQPSPYRRQGKMQRLLSYYVIAALITLMLVSSGVFQAAVNDAVLTTATSTVDTDKTDNIIFNWPSRLIETSSAWTNSIQKKLDF